MTHTIVLLQTHADKATCTWSDHPNVNQAIDAFISIYENRLKELNPNVRNLKYDTRDLMNYIDSLQEVGVLSFDQKLAAYVTHDRDWLKNKVYQHFQKALK